MTPKERLFKEIDEWFEKPQKEDMALTDMFGSMPIRQYFALGYLAALHANGIDPLGPRVGDKVLVRDDDDIPYYWRERRFLVATCGGYWVCMTQNHAERFDQMKIIEKPTIDPARLKEIIDELSAAGDPVEVIRKAMEAE